MSRNLIPERGEAACAAGRGVVELGVRQDAPLGHQGRMVGAGARSRRVGIVALARKLMVALWRYVTHGVVPEGAVLKTAALTIE